MTIILIIYFVGFFICHAIIRKQETNNEGYETWSELIDSFKYSILSWLLLILWVGSILIDSTKKYFRNSKPPKWL